VDGPSAYFKYIEEKYGPIKVICVDQRRIDDRLCAYNKYPEGYRGYRKGGKEDEEWCIKSKPCYFVALQGNSGYCAFHTCPACGSLRYISIRSKAVDHICKTDTDYHKYDNQLCLKHCILCHLPHNDMSPYCDKHWEPLKCRVHRCPNMKETGRDYCKRHFRHDPIYLQTKCGYHTCPNQKHANTDLCSIHLEIKGHRSRCIIPCKSCDILTWDYNRDSKKGRPKLLELLFPFALYWKQKYNATLPQNIVQIITTFRWTTCSQCQAKYTVKNGTNYKYI